MGGGEGSWWKITHLTLSPPFKIIVVLFMFFKNLEPRGVSFLNFFFLPFKLLIFFNVIGALDTRLNLNKRYFIFSYFSFQQNKRFFHPPNQTTCSIFSLFYYLPFSFPHFFHPWIKQSIRHIQYIGNYSTELIETIANIPTSSTVWWWVVSQPYWDWFNTVELETPQNSYEKCNNFITITINSQ